MDVAHHSDDDIRLSAHIRHLLLEYVHTHITTDYIQFTENAVAELVTLSKIPVEDPSALSLPIDPFTTLNSLLQLQNLPPYDEKLQVTHEVQTYIKKTLAQIPGKTKSERVIDDIGFRVDEVHLMICSPMSPPILTRRAIRETPVLGASAPSKSLKKTFRDFMNPRLIRADFQPVDVEEVQEPQINISQVLDVNLQMRAGDRTAVVTLLKPVLSRPSTKKKPHMYLPNSLSQMSSMESHPLRPDSPPFMPIFSRRSRGAKVPTTPRGESHRKNDMNAMATNSKLDSLADLPAFIGADPRGAFDIEDEESFGPEGRKLYEENMVIVDGWHTFATSSPSVLSSGDDDVDQLLFLSSPNTELSPAKLVKDIEASKIEEIQIPRARRIGGAGMDKDGGVKIGKVLKEGLGAFLGPLLMCSSTHMNDPTTADRMDAGSIGAREEDASSTRGQPSSVSGTMGTFHRGEDIPDPDDEIRGIYAAAAEDGQGRAIVKRHPNDLIRDEILFDEETQQPDTKQKDEGIVVRFMPVPNLPAPNTYVVNSASRYRSLKDYLINGNDKQTKASPLRFLKTVQGMASLRVALSWVPFTVSTPDELPNNARLLEIDSLLGDEWTTSATEMQKLLGQCFATETNIEGLGCAEDVVERLWAEADREPRERLDGGSNDFSPEVARYDIILTRGERELLARGVGGALRTECSPFIRNEARTRCSDGDDVPWAQNTFELDNSDQGDWGGERPAKRARLMQVEDDSGIGLIPDDNTIGSKDRNWEEYPHSPRADVVLDFEDGGKDRLVSFGRHTQADSDIDTLSGISDQDKGYGNENMLIDFTSSHGNEYSYNFDQNKDFRDVNKENSLLVSDLEHGQQETSYRDPFGFEYRDDGLLREVDDLESTNGHYEEDYAGGSFEPLPLSFDSQAYKVTKQPQGRTWDDQTARTVDGSNEEWYTRSGLNVIQDTHLHQNRSDCGEPDAMKTNVEARDKTNDTEGIDAAMYTTMDLATKPLGIDTFAMLRARTVNTSLRDALPPSSQPSPTPTSTPGPEQEQAHDPRGLPENIRDHKTLSLPSSDILPTKAHRYMASLDFLQKQVLVRSLRMSRHLVHLAERDGLGGVDLIIDPYTAVIFAPLLSLPSQCEFLLAHVSTQSYQYGHLLVVFEAYPVSRSIKPSSHPASVAASDLNAYTPPIMKAIKKFRRNLDIGEAYGTKAVACNVNVAFADSVDEAAAYARLFGDIAEERDVTQGAIWGQREWLDSVISEYETDLASVAGMNHFSASIILSQVTAQQYIDMTPEERLDSFAPYIGVEAVTTCNAEFEERMHNLQPSEGDGSNSSSGDW